MTDINTESQAGVLGSSETATTTATEASAPVAADAPKPRKPKEITGLVLVDIPALNAKCGEFVTLPGDIAKSYTDSGEFDPKAKPQ
jgi:hypothetical protein